MRTFWTVTAAVVAVATAVLCGSACPQGYSSDYFRFQHMIDPDKT